MTTDNWLTILGMLFVGLGGLYGLIRSDINSMMDKKIGKLKEDLLNERNQELKEENNRLKQWVASGAK